VSYIDQRGVALDHTLSNLLQSDTPNSAIHYLKQILSCKSIIINQFLPVFSSSQLQSYWSPRLTELISEQLDVANQAGALFAHCFRLKDDLPLSLSKGLDEFRGWKHSADLTSVVGIHGRFGGVSVTWRDPAMADIDKAVAGVATLAARGMGHRQGYFICSDSDNFKKRATELLCAAGCQCFAFDNPIFHTDRSGSDVGMWTTVLDFEVLRRCSAIHYSAGGFSRVAAGTKHIPTYHL
jgi:hypothetical protein